MERGDTLLVVWAKQVPYVCFPVQYLQSINKNIEFVIISVYIYKEISKGEEIT